MKTFYNMGMLLTAVALALASCNESRRGNDSNVNETKDEAAAEENADKFAGQSKRDAEFVYDVVESHHLEIKLAELANQRSRSAEVREIAQRLVSDHTAAVTELKNIAQAKAIAVPVQENGASRRTVENLAEESGQEFDKEWCDEMLTLHERDIEKFEDYADDTDDAELSAFIEKTLPKLRDHHAQLKTCKERLEQKTS